MPKSIITGDDDVDDADDDNDYGLMTLMLTSLQVTPDTLRFLLPALCHLIAEEKSRQILLDMKIQEILYTYLSYHWTIFDRYSSSLGTVSLLSPS